MCLFSLQTNKLPMLINDYATLENFIFRKKSGGYAPQTLCSAVPALVQDLPIWLLSRKDAICLLRPIGALLQATRACPQHRKLKSQKETGMKFGREFQAVSHLAAFLCQNFTPASFLSSRLMFWTDWGSSPKIERASMDGTDRKVIVGSEHLKWPNTVAIDQVLQRLYWIDSGENYIGSCNLDGTDLRKIFISNTEGSYGLAVFEGHIYWTQSKGSLFSANQFDGRSKKDIRGPFFRPFTVTIAHPLAKPKGNGRMNFYIPKGGRVEWFNYCALSPFINIWKIWPKLYRLTHYTRLCKSNIDQFDSRLPFFPKSSVYFMSMFYTEISSQRCREIAV